MRFYPRNLENVQPLYRSNWDDGPAFVDRGPILPLGICKTPNELRPELRSRDDRIDDVFTRELQNIDVAPIFLAQRFYVSCPLRLGLLRDLVGVHRVDRRFRTHDRDTRG